MRKEQNVDQTFSEMAQERENAQRALSDLQKLEEQNKYRVFTLVFENGATVTNTNLEKLNEFEMKFARQGIRVAKRY